MNPQASSSDSKHDGPHSRRPRARVIDRRPAGGRGLSIVLPRAWGVALTLVLGLASGCGSLTPSDETLMNIAVSAESATEREAAAVALARRAAIELEAAAPEQLAGFLGSSANVGRLRTLLGREFDPPVQAAAAAGLANARDVESLPRLIDLMNSPATVVRLRSGQAVSSILGVTFQFDPSGPPAARARAVAAYRTQYDLSLGARALDRDLVARLIGPEGRVAAAAAAPIATAGKIDP